MDRGARPHRLTRLRHPAAGMVDGMPDEIDLVRFTWQDELWMLARVLVAGLAGGIIGFERRYSGKRAGVRTVSMVGFGAGVFTVLSIYGFEGADTGRVAAQVASGVGFLGAGTILRRGGDIRGLTTAAAIWVAAALGAAAGAGLFVVAIGGAFIATLALGLLPHDIGPHDPANPESGPPGPAGGEDADGDDDEA